MKLTVVSLSMVAWAALAGCGDDSASDGGSSEGGSSEGGSAGSSEGGSANNGGSSSDGGSAPSDVPDNAYCSPVSGWDPAWAAFEAEVIELVNAHRAAGADCGAEGSFGPAGPLTADPSLRCAARVHSLDMFTRDYFDHSSPEGEGPDGRIEKAGYDWTTYGENIAGGYPDPASAVAGWMSSDGHCSNIMSPDFVHTGVGYHGGAALWTQVFGAN
jgi:uncharacterized protein YkwD